MLLGLLGPPARKERRGLLDRPAQLVRRELQGRLDPQVLPALRVLRDQLALRDQLELLALRGRLARPALQGRQVLLVLLERA